MSLNPATPVASLSEIIRDADLVLVMSVNPGFGGQKFIPSVLDKIRRVRELIDRTQSRTLLEVDGGVKPENAAEVISAGADVIVSGSAVFCSPDYAAAIAALRSGRETAAPTSSTIGARR